MLPTIALVITAYNRDRYLGAAIESILTQTRGDFELLIWDDGSTDSSAEIAREYAKRDHRVRVIVAEHLGRGLALKSAISQTTAPYIGWVDSDDLLAPTALSETAAVLDKKPDIGWVYTDYLDIDEKDTILSYGYRCLVPYSREELLNKFMTFHFRLIRREVFELAGGIDESLEVVEDYDLCMRLSEIAKVEHIFKPLYYYRSHPNSLSWQRSYQQIQYSYKAVVKAQKRRKSWRNSIVASFIPLLLGLFPNFAQAQSITPANDGTGTVVNNQDNNINISGGSLSSDNTNLFHSFSQFGLDANQTANFLANPQIQNILGRVTGGNASIINGLIQVTGGNANLYLMNPAGIIFGGNSSLNVPAAFTATTANGIQFGNQWFNAIGTNNYSNLIGNPTGFGFTTNQPGSIFNAGNLAVGEGQSLTLLGGTVMNTGTITAPGGNIKIMAVPGEKIVRITPENSLLSVDLPLDTQSQINPQGFSPLSLPQLLTGGNLPTATGFAVENGEIKLTSTNTVIPTNPGTNIISGQISVANSGNTNNTTPEIQILGDRIALFNANINANGVNGGTVLIGGDYQGQGTVPTASSTFVSSDSIITADGLQNGGKVIVWADDATRFFGTISAKGVNGGFVETSGKNFLDVNGATVDASGSNGQAGTWLLDPTDINIISGSTGTLAGGIFDPATNSTIAPSTIESALNSGTNVTITTASGTGGNGDITLIDPINQTGLGSASLTLTGRRFFRSSPYGIINMNSTGALTFNINQVNPETTAPNSSIQNAIDAIGTVAGGTTINLGAGTYTGDPGVPIYIKNPLRLSGSGIATTIIDGLDQNCVFEILTNGTVILNDFTIANGKALGSYGGAINNIATSNTLNINNLAFNNNSAPYGGAIYNSGGTVDITNSIFSNNTAINNGGAIYNSSGTVSINNSTLNGNSSTSDGGAIYNSFGTIDISNSTLNGNSSTSDGGAIYNQGGEGGTVFVSNSTFSGNTANSGGAIYNNGGSFRDISIINSTFSGNTANNGGAIYNFAGTISFISGTLSSNTASNDGGGIYNSSDGNILLKNTIVAGNTISTNPDIFGSVDSASSYNLIGNGTGIGINNGENGNLVGSNITPIDPKLAVLGDYGGTTQTMALLPDSPAINAAIFNPDFTTDQRGITRPQGAAPDIGAFEVVGYTLTPIAGSGQSTTVNTAFSTNLQAEVTEDGFNKAIPNVSVTFNAPDSGASASFTGSNTLITDNNGIVSIPVTANTIAGSYSISANNGILTPANFSLTNNPDVPNSITAIGGTPQTTTVSTAFINQLEAIVKDQFGNVVPNASVTFNAPGSGASASFTGNNTLITDNNGIVSIPVTANTIAGSYSISANNGILTPANFSLTNQSQGDNSFEPTTIIDTNLGKTSISKENQPNSPGGIDEKFTAEFKQYLSIAENTEVVSVNESREILSKINNATGVQPALIYVNFVPTTISDEASQILKSDSDRLELLIITSKGEPIRKVINVTRSQVIEVAKSFKNAITDNTLRRNYKQPGKQMYDWLIQPIESELQKQKIDNLVFIMDGGLRSLPIAALYDGEKHLVERYSVGLMPSLSLTDTNYVDIKKAQVLGMGASTFIDQDPLPAVPTELSAITSQLWTGKSFLNESFTLKNLQNQRKEIPYGIIHLATHGEFQSGSPSNSYIQLWDTRLKMNQLRQLGWNNPPVELVVLSACRSAVGDAQAELGFAGFAVQAGAKSALASLWYVSDEGTLGLMSEFYKQLKTSPIKAEALRQAQIAMLKGEVRIQDGKLRISRGDVNLPPLLKRIGNKDLQHPYFWSAFTMIGNPW